MPRAHDSRALSRRSLWRLCLGAGSTLLAACAEGEAIEEDDPILEGVCEAPPASEGCALTNEDIEGPFYLEDVPERSDLDTAGDAGIALELSGIVRDEGCAPLADVIVEIWHADPAGEYDNSSTQHYRGWVRTDSEGAYAFLTLMPGRYLNGSTYRPSHIHLKAHRDGQEVLTTQIYFANDPYLDEDPWAEESRTVCLEEAGEGVAAVFDLVLAQP